MNTSTSNPFEQILEALNRLSASIDKLDARIPPPPPTIINPNSNSRNQNPSPQNFSTHASATIFILLPQENPSRSPIYLPTTI